MVWSLLEQEDRVDARDAAALGDDHAMEDIGQLILLVLSGCVTNQLKDSGLVDSSTIPVLKEKNKKIQKKIQKNPKKIQNIQESHKNPKKSKKIQKIPKTEIINKNQKKWICKKKSKIWKKFENFQKITFISKKLKILETFFFSIFLSFFLKVLTTEEISLWPELSSQARFRIKGGPLSVTEEEE